MRVLYSELLLVEVGILGGRGGSTARADDILESLSDCYVFTSDLVVLGSQSRVIRSFVLCLQF